MTDKLFLFQLFTLVRGTISLVLASAACVALYQSFQLLRKQGGGGEHGQASVGKEQISLTWKGRGTALIALSALLAFASYLAAPKGLKYTERTTLDGKGKEVSLEEQGFQSKDYVSVDDMIEDVQATIKEREEELRRRRLSGGPEFSDEVTAIEASLADLRKQRDELLAIKKRSGKASG